MKEQKNDFRRTPPRKIDPLRTAGAFALVGCLWILLSDRALSLFISDPSTLTSLQTYKGWFFILASASILFIYLRRQVVRHEQQDDNLESVMHELDREKSRFEAVIAAMGEGISIQDTNYRVLYQNQVHRDVVNGDHLGERCYRAYQHRDAVCPGCHLRHAFQDGKVHRSEQARATEKGMRHYEIVASPLLDNSGKVIAGIEMVRDITERKRLEELNRDILQAIDEAFIVIDRDFRVVSANRAYGEQVRMPVEDIIGKHCYAVSHKTDRPCFETDEECTVRQTFDTGLPHAAVHTHRDSMGNYVYVETKSYPMRDSAGAIVSVIETINDITSKRSLEEQLRHALKMEALGTLTGGIAHDFNNILTAILGYTSILKRQSAQGPASAGVIDSLLGAANRAAGLTKSLLTFSRKQTLEPHPFDLNETVRRVEALLARIIGEDVRLSTDMAPGEIVVLGDAGQIEQVLVNLATNARDAMPGGGTLCLSTAVQNLDAAEAQQRGLDIPGVYAVINVVDTGMGMEEDTRKKIFDPFFTTKEVGKGTGLGLSIVYGIVKQHRGNVNVVSAPGTGSTFQIWLPSISSRTADRQNTAAEAAFRGSGTILLAEDSPEVRGLARDILEASGYTVIEAADGEDALLKFSAHRDRIRLMILDVIMPRKNGHAVAAAVQATHPHIKTLYISGYAADLLEQRGIAGSQQHILPKPFLPAELLRKVESLLSPAAG